MCVAERAQYEWSRSRSPGCNLDDKGTKYIAFPETCALSLGAATLVEQEPAIAPAPLLSSKNIMYSRVQSGRRKIPACPFLRRLAVHDRHMPFKRREAGRPPPLLLRTDSRAGHSNR
jgi:hypothetical protein